MIQQTDDDMVARVNAALSAAMAGLIARARLRGVPLVVAENREVAEVNPHELQLPSLTDVQAEKPADHSAGN